MVKNPPANTGDAGKRCRFNPCVGRIHWRRKWQPTPVFLPGKSHGQRSLAGYSSSGCQESDYFATEPTHTHTHTSTLIRYIPIITAIQKKLDLG